MFRQQCRGVNKVADVRSADGLEGLRTDVFGMQDLHPIKYPKEI